MPLGLEQRDLVASMETVRRDQAGDPAADDRDPHLADAEQGSERARRTIVAKRSYVVALTTDHVKRGGSGKRTVE
jgi:hypothetical protein